MGPTAAGKSGAAVRLARDLPFEIVNMDASQLYAGMDIGTAKPAPEERAGVPHHLFDVSTPDRPLDAGRYVEMADEVVREISGRGRVPLFVGGTGLYARALLFGLARIPEVEPSVRREIRMQMDRQGSAAMHARLAEVDPAAAARISPNDPQRISRALEVHRQTGRPISEFQAGHGFRTRRHRYAKAGMDVPKDELRERIERRVGRMFDAGFPAEVSRLLEAGYSPELRTFKALGYREVARFLAGLFPEEEARRRVASLHARYAKRQRTWFGKEPDTTWFAPGDDAGLRAFFVAFLSEHGYIPGR